jgi:leucyl-tRNA synthetase
MKRYNPTEIESKWQSYWEETKSYIVHDDDPRPKYYNLVEFPYPSGAGLHVGHCRPYVTFDILSRWRRMSGENVLFPMGWDAFGLPAEQYAIKTGVHPSKVTADNINTFRKQEKKLGLSFDWSREFSTADPKVYKWTQWIFLNFFKKGLAYQGESLVWWCEDLKSVLADEEVINGRSERGDYPCERRPLRQWMLAITKYAERLYDDLEDVDYTESIKAQQRNWIGKSKGVEIDFEIKSENEKVTIFTTRPDTLYGTTYLVLAPEHPLVAKITTEEQKKAVEAYVVQTASRSDLTRQEEIKEKTGVFTGAEAVNPINGESIPIWISDYVLMSYGQGAVMGVPAHDERDFEFVKKFDLPIVRVIKNDASDDEPTEDEGVLINSGKYSGMRSEEAREAITKDLVKAGKAVEKTNFKLRDWVFSRQRYWGEPFPIVWVKKSDSEHVSGLVEEWLPKKAVTKKIGDQTFVAVPITPPELPVELPEVVDFKPKGLGQGPLSNVGGWSNVWYNTQTGETKPLSSKTKPEGHWVEGQRETDTMPNWAGSSWYFLRYLDSKNDKELAAKDKIEKWMPVDWYNGGSEHTTLHLLYSRFWHKFLYDQGIVNTSEPYKKRTSHGIVLADDGRKMSKSWGNVVDPMEVVKDYGADTLRLYTAFIGPFEQTVAWNPSGVAGCRRFIDRFWTITQDFISAAGDKTLVQNEIKNIELNRVVNHANKRISTDLSRLGFNTAVAALMEAVNSFYKINRGLPFKGNEQDWSGAINQLLILSAPFMPHVAEELWSELGHKDSILSAAWPQWDDKALVSENVTVIVQVNGKLRGQLEVALDSEESEIVKLAKADKKIAEHLKDKTIKKEIYIKNKLLNFVTS